MSGGILQNATRNTNVRLELQYNESFNFTGSEEPEIDAGIGLPGSDLTSPDESACLLKMI